MVAYCGKSRVLNVCFNLTPNEQTGFFFHSDLIYIFIFRVNDKL